MGEKTGKWNTVIGVMGVDTENADEYPILLLTHDRWWVVPAAVALALMNDDSKLFDAGHTETEHLWELPQA